MHSFTFSCYRNHIKEQDAESLQHNFSTFFNLPPSDNSSSLPIPNNKEGIRKMEKKNIRYLDFQFNNEDFHYEKYSDDEHLHMVKKRPDTVKKRVKKGAGTAVANGADLAFIRNGIGVQANTGVSKHEAETGVHVAELAKLKVLSADAGARAINASASASASPVGAKASAKANVAEAAASAALVEGLIEAKASAVALEAKAHASAGLENLGVLAGAEVSVAKVEAGISHTPLQAHAKGPGAEAEAGASWTYAGVSAGAHAGEVRAGPFAVRAGVKFGGGIRNGVPEVDLGPVTVPCSVM
ncbi:uncharacterized protein LOC143109100 [Alosa pseudoharengus]|uniref:uncharacterized protein LOC143109100 n=1 Tax=Alosa pseudoharengus TaxID=34774 RepID=UPI003F88A6DE